MSGQPVTCKEPETRERERGVREPASQQREAWGGGRKWRPPEHSPLRPSMPDPVKRVGGRRGFNGPSSRRRQDGDRAHRARSRGATLRRRGVHSGAPRRRFAERERGREVMRHGHVEEGERGEGKRSEAARDARGKGGAATGGEHSRIGYKKMR
jgi:hypothetical protein